MVTLRSGRELPQPAPQQELRPTDADSRELQKQTRAESISDNQLENRVPAGSNSSTRRNAESDSNSTKADSISVNRSRLQKLKAEIMLAHLVPNPNQVGQSDLKLTNDNSSSLPPPIELKPLLSHLKYTYLDTEQQLPVIIANNLHQEQEDKLLYVLRQHKKAIGWKLSDLPGINPSICMHRILMEEEARPIRQQKRRLNSTILDMVKKEVTKLLAARIIYPILDSQWVSLVQDSTDDLSRISTRLPYHYPNDCKRMWTLNLTSPALNPSKS
ncbi:hypothetical protein CR513_33392, partial [Mucuna pruriens]